jgi:hypothetical protein
MKEDWSKNHDGISPDEWGYTAELLKTLDGLNRWLWAETREEAESAEEYLRSAGQKIAIASENVAKKNREYFQNGLLHLDEFQTAFRTGREWSEILEAGGKAAFPKLDFFELAKIGGVPDLRGNVESLLVLAYLRHASKNRKRFLQHQDTDQEQENRASREPDIIYDVTIVGLSPDGLSRAITGAAVGLKTLLIEQDANTG